MPSQCKGDVTVDGAMYHVWMGCGALVGARFDKAFDGTTDMVSGPEGMKIPFPALSADDSDTAARELRTHLIITASAADGEGTFSMGDLLSDGMETDEGDRFVADAVDTISKVRSDVAALLSLETAPTGLDMILEGQWDKLEMALDTVFNTDSAAQTGATSAVRMTAPREEDILDEIDDALASEDAFVAATAAGGGGVFDSQELGTDAAADKFNRVKWSATARPSGRRPTTRATGSPRRRLAPSRSLDDVGDLAD